MRAAGRYQQTRLMTVNLFIEANSVVIRNGVYSADDPSSFPVVHAQSRPDRQHLEIWCGVAGMYETLSLRPVPPTVRRMVSTSFLFWGGVLVVSVFAGHWGAERLAEPLKKIRKQWGLTAVAGGAFVGLASASPEIGINAVSASRGVADIGLGVMFGSDPIDCYDCVLRHAQPTAGVQIPRRVQ